MPDQDQMVKRQGVLADFGDFALRSESLDEVLTEACRLVSEALGTVHAKVLEIQDDGRSILVRAGIGWPPGVVGRVRLQMRDHSSETYSIRLGKPVISQDISREERFDVPPFLRDADVVALVNVPIFLPGGRAYGLLQVDSREPREFDEADTEFLRTYATILGPVIDRLHKTRRLQTTEERFRLIVEAARDYAIFVTDSEDRITDWLPGAEAVFGWTPGEAVGQSASILFTPEDRAARQDEAEIETARREGVAPNRRWHLRKDGARVFIDGTVTALRGSRGDVRGFLKIGQDVTERRWTEEALRASEERHRTLFEASERKAAELSAVLQSMGDAVYMGGLDGITLVNQPALDQLGFTTREELNRHIGVLAEEIQTRDAETGSPIPEEKQAFARALGGERVVHEVRIRHRLSGEEHVVRCSASPVVLDGQVVAAVAVNTDITERRAAEERLRESEARFRHMADSAPALIWTTDADAQVAFANMHHDHLFGRPAADMRGEGWQSVVLEEDRGPFRAAFDAAFQTRQPLRTEVRVRDRSGEVRWLRCECVPRLDDVGHFLGYTCCGVDITEARLAAEELERRVAARTAELMVAEETIRQAQKMEAVGQLTGGIAHDFNNMLQGVVGGLAMARRQIAEGRSGRATRYLDAAYGAAERAAGLTRRLLAFARRQRLEPKLVDADGLVAGLADLIRRTMGPEIAVELRLRDGRGSVLCDPHELESALVNLCINARDAMAEGGRLTISTEEVHLSAAEIPDSEAPPGSYLALAVADTGIGIPHTVLERVFEPFFTTKPQGQGTGLGLSQVYGFVRQSGGLVRIESAPGRGTTVRLLLPLREEAPAAEEPDLLESRTATGVGGTVLLVDDEEAVRRPTADRLRELGLTVLEARDGPEALRILVSVRPDLLVTDVGLPNGINGRQLAETARERVPGLPVLFITGFAGTSLPPGFGVIDKPFELETLVDQVQSMLPASDQRR